MIEVFSWATPGLWADFYVLQAAMAPRMRMRHMAEAKYGPKTRRHLLRRLRQPSLRRPSAQIHLQNIFKHFLVPGIPTVWIPNQEWIEREDYEALDAVDLILTRTHFAHQLLCNDERFAGIEKQFVGFSVLPRSGLLAPPDTPSSTQPLQVLHVAGLGEQRQTNVVVGAWRRHPEWPKLTVVAREVALKSLGIDAEDTENLRFITEFLPSSALARLRQSHAVNLQPSKAEGWGHAIVEGMAAGQISMTTDAPPMNELVSPERGILLKCRPGPAMGIDVESIIDEASLEAGMESLLSLSPSRRVDMRRAGHAWVVQTREDFPRRLRAVFA